jgi:hypothetical protein
MFQRVLDYYGINPQDYTEKHDMLALSAKCTYEFCRSDCDEVNDELYDHYNVEIDSEDIELLEKYCKDYFGVTVKVAPTGIFHRYNDPKVVSKPQFEVSVKK